MSHHEHVTTFAPGRVNLIGEHTDYNDGLALPFAIAEGITVTAQALYEDRVEAHARNLGEDDGFWLGGVEPAPGWRAFLRGVVGELQRSGVAVRGCRLEIGGDLAQGAGLSSSAALEVSLALALLALAGELEPDRIALAKLCSRVENDWVGAETGLLDQLASLCGSAENCLRIDFRTLSVRSVRLELGPFRLLTLDSGEEHSHAGSGYNERRRECRLACEQLGIASLRDASDEMVERLRAPLSNRARHVLTENARVKATVDALERRDLEEVGRLLDASHASLRDLYEVSTPAVERAVERLRDAGALGSRIIGGGFGGHVLGLFPPGAATPEDALAVRPGDGARVLAR
jgi:galactokinase